jgi:hypothetical protein
MQGYGWCLGDTVVHADVFALPPDHVHTVILCLAGWLAAAADIGAMTGLLPLPANSMRSMVECCGGAVSLL